MRHIGFRKKLQSGVSKTAVDVKAYQDTAIWSANGTQDNTGFSQGSAGIDQATLLDLQALTICLEGAVNQLQFAPGVWGEPNKCFQ